MTARVPAKLNLQLAVGPPRADGYHGLITVFHAVSLFDEVTVEPAARDTVRVTGEGSDRVPADRDNLALRAVAALRAALPRRAARPGGVHVTIAKRIPVAAGLAGGSADAAAALVACNELWASGLSQQRLAEVAARVGSDVAFALVGGTAVGRGRGEQLTPALVPATQYHWVLAFADGQLATPAVYAALDRLRAARSKAGPGTSPIWTPRSCRRCAPAMPSAWAVGSATTCSRPRCHCSPRCARRSPRPGARRAGRAGGRFGPDLRVPVLQRRAGAGAGRLPVRRRRMPVGGPGRPAAVPGAAVVTAGG